MTQLSLYEKTAADIIRRIRAGEWPPGSRMPSKKALESEYHIAYGTLAQAFSVLKDGEWIETRPGIGTFVCDPLPDPEAPSEFEQVMARMGELTAEVRRLRERVDQLEQAQAPR